MNSPTFSPFQAPVPWSCLFTQFLNLFSIVCDFTASLLSDTRSMTSLLSRPFQTPFSIASLFFRPLPDIFSMVRPFSSPSRTPPLRAALPHTFPDTSMTRPFPAPPRCLLLQAQPFVWSPPPRVASWCEHNACKELCYGKNNEYKHGGEALEEFHVYMHIIMALPGPTWHYITPAREWVEEEECLVWWCGCGLGGVGVGVVV